MVSVFSQTAKTTLKESFLVEYVAQKENVKPEDVNRIVLKKDKSFKHGVILLSDSTSCGTGLCTYYSFVKNSNGSFDFSGLIEGVFEKTKSIKGSDLPEIWTKTKSSTDLSKEMKWTFNKDSKVYEAK